MNNKRLRFSKKIMKNYKKDIQNYKIKNNLFKMKYKYKHNIFNKKLKIIKKLLISINILY